MATGSLLGEEPPPPVFLGRQVSAGTNCECLEVHWTDAQLQAPMESAIGKSGGSSKSTQQQELKSTKGSNPIVQYQIEHSSHYNIAKWSDMIDDPNGGPSRWATHDSKGDHFRVIVVECECLPDKHGLRRFKLSGLMPGNTYVVRVRCRNSEGWSMWR